MLEMRLRDTRFAFRGLWTRAQAAMKSATLLAPEWRFLARGAAAGQSKASFHSINLSLKILYTNIYHFFTHVAFD
jgi:hypothetical protein